MSFFSLLQAQEIEDFSLDNLDNELISLSEIKGESLTIIDFWGNLV